MLDWIKNKALGGILIGITTTLLLGIFALILGDLARDWHLRLADNLYTLNEQSEEIIIVAIDDRSVMEIPVGLGKVSSWSRKNYSDAINLLNQAGAKTIGFDILISNPSQSVPVKEFDVLKQEIQDKEPSDKYYFFQSFIEDNSDINNMKADNQLADALNNFENKVVLPITKSLEIKEEEVILPYKKFHKNTILSSIAISPDKDGVFRKYPLKLEMESDALQEYDSFAVAIAKNFRGEEINIENDDNKMLINYFNDPFKFKMVSALDVLNKNIDMNIFKDKVVLIGITSFKEIQDNGLTPKSNEVSMAGVEIHANALQTILSGKFLKEQGAFSIATTILAITIILAMVFNYAGIWLSIIFFIASFAVYWQSGHFLFGKGLIINMFYPFIAIILVYIFSWIYQYFITDKHKREISTAFGHYVSKDLVEEISKNPLAVKLGGEKKVITVFFSDIKDSTKISENVDISLWVSQINEYFTEMESVIQNHNGTVDKYEGDAIMGFWNAPISSDNHIQDAYKAALQMNQKLEELKSQWAQQGKPVFEMRIGINTGEAIVGNFGSVNRFDYTAMGDTVNTASRLESSANKTYGTSIVTAGFENHLPAGGLGEIILREIDTVYLPGKDQPVKLYELVCFANEFSGEIKQKIETYSSALNFYKNKDFVNALNYFNAIINDPPAKVMIERCEKILRNEIVEGLDENLIFRIKNK